MAGRLTPETGAGQLEANLAGDAAGLPDWSSHFGSDEFAESALPGVMRQVERAYPKGSLVDVVSVAGGNALYERVIGRELAERGWKPRLMIMDLQPDSLAGIPRYEDFPVWPLRVDVTSPLPLRDREQSQNDHAAAPRLIISRAFEHYLPEPGLVEALRNIASALADGELYAAQLTSGDVVTDGALSEAVRVLAGKDVRYLPVANYLNIVSSVQYENGMPMFKVIAREQADTQTNRGALAQARRYLNARFLELNVAETTDELSFYEADIDGLHIVKEELGAMVRSGSLTREDAIQQLDQAIAATAVFGLFRSVYVQEVMTYLQAKETQPERGTKIIYGADGQANDVMLDIEYPIVFLEKLPSHPRA